MINSHKNIFKQIVTHTKQKYDQENLNKIKNKIHTISLKEKEKSEKIQNKSEISESGKELETEMEFTEISQSQEHSDVAFENILGNESSLDISLNVPENIPLLPDSKFQNISLELNSFDNYENNINQNLNQNSNQNFNQNFTQNQDSSQFNNDSNNDIKPKKLFFMPVIIPLIDALKSFEIMSKRAKRETGLSLQSMKLWATQGAIPESGPGSGSGVGEN